MGTLSFVYISFAALALAIAGLYFYLFARTKERFIQYWGLCWVFYSLSLLFLILGQNFDQVRLFEVRKVFDVFNILFFLFGGYVFSNLRIPGYWMRFTLYLMIWIGISVFYDFQIMAIYLPLSMFQIVITTVLCVIIYRGWQMQGVHKWISIAVFLLWGYGKAISSLYEGYFSQISSLYLIEILFSNVLSFMIFILYLERVGDRLGFAEKIFKMIAENASDVIFIYSLKPVPSFSYISPSVEQLLGYSPQEFYADGRYYLNTVATEEVERIQKFFDPHSVDEENENFIFKLLNKSSEPIWGEFSRTVIMENGEPAAIEGILRDVTLQKKAEEQMVQAKVVREQLLSYVSHELKTPVTSILGYMVALRDNTLASHGEREAALDIVINKTLTLESLIQDLFQLSKLETKQFSFKFDMISVKEVTEELIKDYSMDVTKADMKLIISKDLKEHGNELLIADTKRVGQVFNNILVNAMRYSKKGDTIKIKFFVNQQNMYGFSISDEGRGIPRDEMEHIFDRFFKGANEGNKSGGSNTGLGLTICKEIVEAHQGTIEAKSSLGRGSTFTVNIPLYKE